MSGRRDYYHDPAAPRANSLVPGASALVLDEHGRVLLQRRSDSGNWALPGGTMDIGETLSDCVVREVKEEAGLDIEITGLLGIYTDPAHVIAYTDGEVRQEFNITYYGRIVGGELAISYESTDAVHRPGRVRPHPDPRHRPAPATAPRRTPRRAIPRIAAPDLPEGRQRRWLSAHVAVTVAVNATQQLDPRPD